MYFLVDLKVVYIIAFAFISTVDLISSAANVHTTTDKQKIIIFDVSSEYVNVSGKLHSYINDAILWNCMENYQRPEIITRFSLIYEIVLTRAGASGLAGQVLA